MKTKKILALALTAILSISSATFVQAADDNSKTNNIEYVKSVVEKAKSGDKEAIKKVSSYDCFDETKEKEKFPKEGLKLLPGETKTITFNDGSSIVYSLEPSIQAESSFMITSESIYVSVKKTYYLLPGVCGMDLICNVDYTLNTRLVHINSVWGTHYALGGTVSNQTAGIIDNDEQISKCYTEATFTAYLSAGSMTRRLIAGIDGLGTTYIYQ